MHQKALEILSSRRGEIFKGNTLKAEELEMKISKVLSERYFVNRKKRQVQELKDIFTGKVLSEELLEKELFDKLPKDYGKLDEKQNENLRKNAGRIYYQPKTLTEESVAEESLIFNLIDPLLPIDSEDDDGISLCKNLTQIHFKNFGAPLIWLKVENCKIKYLDGKTKRLRGTKPKTQFPLSFDSNGIAKLNISEVTIDQENALCEISRIDPTKHVTEIRYQDDFLKYKEIKMNIVAESSFGVKCRLRFKMKRAGDILAARVYERW